MLTKLLGGGFVIAALLLLVQTTRLNHAKADLKAAIEAQYVPEMKPRTLWRTVAETAAKNLAVCRVARADLTTSLGEQNAAVAALKAEGDIRARQAEKAVLEARRAREGASKAITSMLNGKLPPGADQCLLADQFILKWAGVK